MNILVVDDESIVLESCCRILESEGHSVTLTPTVKKALEQFEVQKFDLLLVDMIMPELDGMYLIDKVTRNHPQLPILVISGYPTLETIDNGLSKGADHFLAKPFTPDELLGAVQLAIEKNQRINGGSNGKE